MISDGRKQIAPRCDQKMAMRIWRAFVTPLPHVCLGVGLYLPRCQVEFSAWLFVTFFQPRELSSCLPFGCLGLAAWLTCRYIVVTFFFFGINCTPLSANASQMQDKCKPTELRLLTSRARGTTKMSSGAICWR